MNLEEVHTSIERAVDAAVVVEKELNKLSTVGPANMSMPDFRNLAFLSTKLSAINAQLAKMASELVEICIDRLLKDDF